MGSAVEPGVGRPIDAALDPVLDDDVPT